jgi:hypothetical protein
VGLVELFVLLAAVGGSTWIGGTVVWLWYRTKRLEESILNQKKASPHLASELESIRTELSVSNEQVGLLRERLDFLERLLNQGDRGSESTRSLKPGESERGIHNP